MAKKYKIRITDYALEQMQEIQRYITASLQAPDTAVKWRADIKKEMLSRLFPEPYHADGGRTLAQ